MRSKDTGGYSKGGGKRRRLNVVLSMFVIAISFLIFEYSLSNNDKDEVQLRESDKPATLVLLVGYSDSASVWSRDVVSYAQESFYVSEPLKMLLPDGYYKKHLVCFNNNTCRPPQSQTEQEEFVIHTFYRLFTCKFSNLHPESMQNILEMYHNRVPFQYCSSEPSWKSAECIEEMERLCRSKTHRVIMTIQLSMEIVNNMMELWSNLKIVHIVQDPRAVIHETEYSTTDNDVKSYSSNLCSWMNDDVQFVRRLQTKYPRRLKLVSLEALAESPFSAAGYLYEFLDMFLYTEKVWFWVYTNIQNMVKRDFYKMSRFNLTRGAHRRRRHLSFQTVEVMDKFCRDT
ncbi:uncharacterized protein LOC128550786 [Mercenaria mercenaria]|uniref:uncharacterized protein LOC128550786 n=1 Tax=Mercenaria mercenaria TaxID=6596 RepID=UPI00234EC875|nr:uncharacterized protein LOC128550786 [Mercenaria mercenaria]